MGAFINYIVLPSVCKIKHMYLYIFLKIANDHNVCALESANLFFSIWALQCKNKYTSRPVFVATLHFKMK